MEKSEVPQVEWILLQDCNVGPTPEFPDLLPSGICSQDCDINSYQVSRLLAWPTDFVLASPYNYVSSFFKTDRLLHYGFLRIYTQREVNLKEKNNYCVLMHIFGS